MFRRIFSYGGLLLLAGAVLFATPGPAWARPGRFGGARFGGARFGLGGFGGYRGGFYRGGYRPFYGYRGYYRPAYGFYPYYGYGFYPYSYGYDYYPDYATDPYLWAAVTTPPLLSDGSAEVTPVYPEIATSGTTLTTGYQSHSTPGTGTGQPDGSARMTVIVPPTAEVSIDDTMTLSKGAVRQYDSPPLTPGTRYTYDIKASWNENGHEVTQTQRVEVTAGAQVYVRFPAPPQTTGQASAATHG
jgi:uncharacterized protein (TIGR03000 family)